MYSLKYLSIVAGLFGLLMLPLDSAAQQKKNTGKLMMLSGKWEPVSVKFRYPVDLNKDGKASANAFEEYTDCQKQLFVQFTMKSTARLYNGRPALRCGLEEQQFTISIEDREVVSYHIEDGQRIEKRENKTFIIFKGGSEMESLMWELMSVDNDKLVVRTELYDGSDSTSDAVLVWEKYRPAKKVSGIN
jgi:hypothetical protein